MPELTQVKEYKDAVREAAEKSKAMLALDGERKAAVNEDGTLDATVWTDAKAEEYDRIGQEALGAQTHAESLMPASKAAEFLAWSEAKAGNLPLHSTTRRAKSLREAIFGENPEPDAEARAAGGGVIQTEDGKTVGSFLRKNHMYDTGVNLGHKDSSYGVAIGSGNSMDQLVVPSYSGDVTHYPRRPIIANKLFGTGQTSVFVWKYFLQDRPTWGAAAVANTLVSSATKPMSELTYELATEQAHVVAHYTPIHKTALANIPQLESIIRDDLMYGLEYTVDYQLLWGSQSVNADNILGLYNRGQSAGGLPGVQTFASTGIANTQLYDDIKHMATKTYMNSFFPATVCGLTPAEQDTLLTAKTSGSGEYVYGVVPFTQGNGETVLKVWGLELVVSPVFMNPVTAAGSVFVGNPLFGKVMTQDSANITVGWTDKQFIQNAETLLAETTVGLEVSRPYGWTIMDLPNSDGVS